MNKASLKVRDMASRIYEGLVIQLLADNSDSIDTESAESAESAELDKLAQAALCASEKFWATFDKLDGPGN